MLFNKCRFSLYFSSINDWVILHILALSIAVYVLHCFLLMLFELTMLKKCEHHYAACRVGYTYYFLFVCNEK